MPMPLREYEVAMFGEAREDRFRERPFGVGKSRSAGNCQWGRIKHNLFVPEVVAFSAPYELSRFHAVEEVKARWT